MIAGSARAPLVEFRAVSKGYDRAANVVDGLDLAIRRGEFLTLLGPSGSGKTTTLMMLAGFEEPDAGEIFLAGHALAGVPPHKRNMGVVFQNYALFPHMTVAENLAFPLQVRRVRGKAARERVEQALDLVNLPGFGQRRVNEISGGQQQRVALARALIFDPDLVLMDEPLGALDRHLREKLQGEIKQIQHRTGVTVVYVTHDQSEALALSDRIAVFAQGRIQQLDTPSAIYDRPANAFVASFVGDNNCLEGVVVERGAADHCMIGIGGKDMVSARAASDMAIGDRVVVTIRPEHLHIGHPGAPAPLNLFSTRIEDRIYHGDHSRLRVRLPGGAALTVRLPAMPDGDRITLGWSAEHCCAFRLVRDAA